MGKRVILLLLALVPMAGAQTRVTVKRLDELLASLHHQSDAKTAHEIAGYELTERVSSATLADWVNRFRGKRTGEALTALADSSAFMNPPASDVPDLDSPDKETRSQIFARVVAYVVKVAPKLPNFSALRTTQYFETASLKQLHEQHLEVYQQYRSAPSHSALGPVDTAKSVDRQLLFAGEWSRTVTYRNGLEVEDKSQTNRGDLHAAPAGLTTKGEFGPILWVVTHDMVLSNHVTWSHWEQGTTDPLAVFKYEVTSDLSHYAVGAVDNASVEFPAYHGEIAVEPATGTILRITVVADRQSTELNPLIQSAILVEYGPVTIGGNSYICPVRAVATSKESSVEKAAFAGDSVPSSSTIFVNDVSFTQYHVFRAESRVLSGSEALH